VVFPDRFLAPLISSNVDQDAHKPCLFVRQSAGNGSRRTGSLEEGFLREIVGERDIAADQIPEQTSHTRLMIPDELREGAFVPALRAQHELALGGWTALHRPDYTAPRPRVPGDGRRAPRGALRYPRQCGDRYVEGCTCFSVFSDATSTFFGIGANQSFAVYLLDWPCVSAQKTIFRSSVAFDDFIGRMMYV